MKNLPLIDIADCFSKTDLITKLNLPKKGNSYKIVEKYIVDNNLDITHFDSQKNRRVYTKVTKNCPVCETEFTALERTS